MKKFCVFLLLSAMIVACNKSDDSKLDGKWQLKQIEFEGNIQQVDTVYYNFQTGLFSYMVLLPSGNATQLYGFKNWEDDKELTLEFDEAQGKERCENFRKDYTDWPEIRRTFQIEKLTKKDLIMISDGKRYTFHSF